MKLMKKGQVGGIQVFIMAIVSVAVVLAVGLIVLSELQTAAKVGGVSTGETTLASNARKHNHKISNCSNMDRNTNYSGFSFHSTRILLQQRVN